MVDQEKLKTLVKEKGLTLQIVATELGINTVTLYRKMNGQSEFYWSEINKLVEILGINKPEDIFFKD